MASRGSPSTITRSTGSVPEGRSSTRPRPLSERSASLCACLMPSCFAHFTPRGERAARFANRVQHLQRRDDAVAGGVLVEADEMAGVLAAELPALFAHQFQHVAVADARAAEADAEARHRLLEREVGHQRAGD